MRVSLLLAFALRVWCADAVILDRVHASRVFHETRHYRIFLPPDYESSGKRYPVIYFFHGHSERYNKPLPGKNYDVGSDYGGDTIAAFVAHHDVIVVNWDGFNPRTADDTNPQPYNIGPVETERQFPIYFLEFAAYIDANYRTMTDREHRATAGLSMGGFMSFWIAGKYPDLVSSASSFMGSSEYVVGPREFPVEYRHEEMAGNYAGVRTRLVTGSRDFIRFYHRQMNLVWRMPTYETEEFDSDHGTPGMAKTLAFHMNAFAHPLPRAEIWSHADVYPKFAVWDWSVESDRRQPGFTSLTEVSRSGFQSVVREWLPSGRILREVHLKITTAPLYPKNSAVKVTINRQHQSLDADAEGRLHFDLDGGENVVGIGVETKFTQHTPVIPDAPVTTEFQIADHRTVRVFQRAVKQETMTLGEGNGDGVVNAGEQIAILFPYGDAFRAAELFSNDACVDLTKRVSDNWEDYDWVSASAKYTLARISPTCPAGHVIKVLARVLLPNKPEHKIREATIELRVTR